MPYKLRKARNKELYYVVDSTGDKYSKEPIPLARAKRQITALHINIHGKPKRKLRGGNIWNDYVRPGIRWLVQNNIHYYAGMLAGGILQGIIAEIGGEVLEQRLRIPKWLSVLGGIHMGGELGLQFVKDFEAEVRRQVKKANAEELDQFVQRVYEDRYPPRRIPEGSTTAVFLENITPGMELVDVNRTARRYPEGNDNYYTPAEIDSIKLAATRNNAIARDPSTQEPIRNTTIYHADIIPRVVGQGKYNDPINTPPPPWLNISDKKINGEGKDMDDKRYRMLVRSLSNIPPPPSYPHPDEPYIVSTRNPLRNPSVRITTNDYMRQIGVPGMSNLYVDAIRLSQQNQRDEEERARNQARSDAEKARQAAEEQAVRDYYDKRAKERAAKEQEEYKKSKTFGALMYTRVIKPIKKIFSDSNKEHIEKTRVNYEDYNTYLAEKRKRDNFNARQRELNERRRLLGEGMSGSGISRKIRYVDGDKIYDYFNTEGEHIGSYIFQTQEESGLNDSEYKKLWHKDNESRSSRTNLKRKRGKDLNINFNPEIARVVGEVPHLDDLYYQSHPPKDLADVIEDDITELNEARELESRGEPPIYKPPPPVGRGRKRGGMFNPLNTVKSPEDQAKAVLTRILDSANASRAKSELNREGQKTMEEVMNEAARELAMSGNLGAVNYLNTLREPYELKPEYSAQDPTSRNRMAKEMGLTLAGKGRKKKFKGLKGGITPEAIEYLIAMFPPSPNGMTADDLVDYWETLQPVLTPDDKVIYADILKRADKYHKLLKKTIAAKDQLITGDNTLALAHPNIEDILEITEGRRDPESLLPIFLAFINRYGIQAVEARNAFTQNIPELDVRRYEETRLPSQVVAPPPPMDDERSSFGPVLPRKHEKYDYHEDKNGQGRLKFAKKYLKGQGLPHSRKECEKLCSVMDAEGVVFE